MARRLLPTLSSPENIPYTLFFPHQKGVKCRLDEVATVWESLAYRPPQIEDGRPADSGRVFSRHVGRPNMTITLCKSISIHTSHIQTLLSIELYIANISDHDKRQFNGYT